MKLRRMLMIAAAVPIILVQEQMLVFIPNVQFTVLLIILFSSIFSLKESLMMILVYVFLDSMFMGTMDPFYMIPLTISWSLIPFSYHTFLRKTNNEYILASFAFVFGFVFGWIFIPFRMIQFGVNEAWPYFLSDIPFEIIMAVVGYATVILVFKPLRQALVDIIDQETYEAIKTK